MLILSLYNYTWLAKETRNYLYQHSKSVGSYDVIVYGWYSDHSVLLQEAGVYLRPGV